ncbi:MAG: YXWGXW repeat-containing protein, partial [Candidatus Korobacteraceae bacterium]
MARSRSLVLLAVMILATAVFSLGEVAISVSFGPPVLPVYSQPYCPAPGYIWTPGYWAWSPDQNDYYWVPGTWVPAPQPGFLWTPGYWGFSAGFYRWNPGYWGPQVGFYGGINYGFGYPGDGYYGGRWQGRDFYYNRAVNNVNITNVNVYNQTVNNVTVNRVAYNGGPGGIQAQPTQQQLA